MLTRIAALAFLVACAPPSRPPTTEPPARSVRLAHPFDAELQAAFDHYAADALERYAIPGAAIAVVQGGHVVYARGFGVRELGRAEPITPTTLMMMGSLNKSMTTMMMATLVDDGKLHWDTRAVDVLDSFALRDPILTRAMTMRDLVCNCSGIARHDLELEFDARPRTPAELIRSLRRYEVEGTFGKTFGYSNQLVATGGYLAARADRPTTGDLYGDYAATMQRRVFDPIGMTHTTFSFDRVRATADRATPHGLAADGTLHPLPLELESFVIPLAPAGGAWTDVMDLARYATTQLARGVAPDGTRVVGAENLDVTWQPRVAVSPNGAYALGWGVARYHDMRLLTHDGGTYGFTSNLTLLPDEDFGVVVLANAQAADAFVSAIWQRAVELAFHLPTAADAKLARQAEIRRASWRERVAHATREVAGVREFLGDYDNSQLGRVTLALEADSLVLRFGALTSELRAVGNGRYIVWDPPLALSELTVTLVSPRGSPQLRIESAGDETTSYVFARR